MSKTHISSGLRRLVQERAKGFCEYCLIPEIATFASSDESEKLIHMYGTCHIQFIYEVVRLEV